VAVSKFWGIPALIAASKDKDTLIALNGVDSMFYMARKGMLPLEEPIVQALISGLGYTGAPYWKQEEIKNKSLDTLKELTGKDFRWDQQAWRQWWNEHKDD